MSLTIAEQICALFRGGSDVPEIADILGCNKSYAYRALFVAGLRGKTFVPFRCLPEADLPPRVHRDPCSFCNVRADIGCRHNGWAA